MLMDHREIAGRFNAAFGRAAFGRAGVGLTSRPDSVDRTRLVGGAAEPVYQPATAERPAIIRYTRDFAPSVLHELAHWCLASPADRRRADYGLIYDPPPRGPLAQRRFYNAEVGVQALERLLAETCGLSFRISTDNPGVDDWPAVQRFEVRVEEAYRRLLREGAPPLALRVLDVLSFSGRGSGHAVPAAAAGVGAG
jgi:hypothetical protein